MIDLHMHTINSDGTDSTIQLLTKANNIGLEVISITDHNTCKQYNDLKNIDYKNIYKGNIIIGCEFTTSFKGRPIEVLGYDFDISVVEEYLNQYYNEDSLNKQYLVLQERLFSILDILKVKYDKEKLYKTNFVNEFFIWDVYAEIIKYEENNVVLRKPILDSLSNFWRLGVANPESILYINSSNQKPTLDEIISLIHKAKGKAFLAHPYLYKIEKTELFLRELYDSYDFDGIECYHTTFTPEQMNYLLQFAKQRNLLISGGSDYHGTNKTNQLGVGNGNLNINKDIINNWNTNFFE